jgi:hypothetical protein
MGEISALYILLDTPQWPSWCCVNNSLLKRSAVIAEDRRRVVQRDKSAPAPGRYRSPIFTADITGSYCTRSSSDDRDRYAASLMFCNRRFSVMFNQPRAQKVWQLSIRNESHQNGYLPDDSGSGCTDVILFHGANGGTRRFTTTARQKVLSCWCGHYTESNPDRGTVCDAINQYQQHIKREKRIGGRECRGIRVGWSLNCPSWVSGGHRFDSETSI